MAQAALVPIIASVAGGLVGTAGSLLAGKPKMPAAPKVPTRNDAAEAARQSDQFRRRRGAGANELTGGGAEASSGGGKTLLGQ